MYNKHENTVTANLLLKRKPILQFQHEQFITLEFYKQPHKKKHSIYEKGDFHAIFV